ncbi:MAG: RNA polymerase sigma factor [Cyclobacteriaceae bacterium]|nr:RNA polymerase sigma factor [Cyclobacteriaceae bacterium]MCB0500012.1 RNA polymerase sigma factor [Cyclobacteriaceae bacterium]MCB9237170.1 RNA polymerase sigma factor [Flammeovirgaceae bacterium]MCW5901835.1 RNA polymerase sigma factor [Cyclobacteriaceae bacterium]
MDLKAFENRVLPAKNKLFRFALRLLNNMEEAEDVVQEVLIKVWNGRSSMHQVHNWEAWCMRLTRNLALDRLRAQKRKATGPIELGFEAAQDGLSPHEKAELTESMLQVNELIASLPKKQRQVMHLRDVEGYSYNEIVEIMEMDMNQVKVSLFRARSTVRRKLVKINAYGL